MQERRNSIANALELRLSCTNPSMCRCLSNHISQVIITEKNRDSLFLPFRPPAIFYGGNCIDGNRPAAANSIWSNVGFLSFQEFDIDPECDSEQVDELLAACVKQAMADQSSSWRLATLATLEHCQLFLGSTLAWGQASRFLTCSLTLIFCSKFEIQKKYC